MRRDNHYVPQTYLKRWARPDQRVLVYRTLVSHAPVPVWKPHSLKGIAYHQHLYSMAAHGAESDAVERWLADYVDGPSDAVLSKVASEAKLTEKDWAVLLRFFAASQARTPAFLLRRQRAWDKELPARITLVLNNTVAAIEQGSVGREHQPRGLFVGNVEMPMRTRVRNNPSGEGSVLELEVLAGRKLWFLEIERLVAHTARALHTMHWTILRPPDGQHWITSDDPALVVRVSPDGKLIPDGGWKVPGSVLILPLDPMHVLFGALKGPLPVKYSLASESTARFIQNCIARHAFRAVFSAERADWVQESRPRRVDPDAYAHERNELEFPGFRGQVDYAAGRVTCAMSSYSIGLT